MNVLIIGSGGREHALAWKALQSPTVEKVFVAPGNAGTALEENIENINIDVLDFPSLIQFAKASNIGLTIIGPEVPLVEGIVDEFEKAGLLCFGPKKDAAQLEGSKAFTKDFLARHNIPTAAYANFTANEKEAALNYVRQQGTPIVIKADGLAAGKGVIIAQTQEEAEQTIHEMLSNQSFGEASRKIVIEEFLQGEEASYIVMSDGINILPFATSQDHKARDNGDKGPNTGGMGAYSPAPVVTPQLDKRILEEIILPTIEGMAKDGYSYTGFLYAGLMIDEQQNIKVLEYNCRFGDPETQPIMMRLNSDLIELCLAALDKTLAQHSINWDSRSAVGVVMAAGGYPAKYEKHLPISGLPEDKADTKVFHAGTLLKESQDLTTEHHEIVTNGGRVLCATALGNSVSEAQAKAYDLVRQISWEKAYFRTDIGYKAVLREQSE